jgi:hypothetical protein
LAKQPRAGGNPESRKEAKAGADPASFAREPLSWRMGLVDFEGKWGWRKLEDDDLSNLHDRFKSCEGESLAKLKHAKRATPIPTEQICPDAQKRLPQIGLGDRDQLWELRLGYKKWRAWGVIEGSTFYLVWWDPEHSVCGHPPKHVKKIN